MSIFPKAFFFLLVFTSFACGPSNEKPADGPQKTDPAKTDKPAPTDSIPRGQITTTNCKSHPENSYTIYIPGGNHSSRLPVIYFFDPHGDGSLPVKKYQSLADKYGFILAGSNNSKNGNDLATSESIWNTMSADSKLRIPYDAARIYTCGFSGGAKVASHIAMTNAAIGAVIAGGAGLPDGTAAANFNFRIILVSGEGDLNMTELVALNEELDRTQTRHCLLFFEGKHEWWPVEIMETAMEGLQFDAFRNKIIPSDKGMIEGFIAGSRRKINQQLAGNDLLKTSNQCKVAASLLDGLSPEAAWFRTKEISIEHSKAFPGQLSARNQMLAEEQSRKDLYRRQFESGNQEYWTKTIHDLQTGSKAKSALAAMDQRLLAYLSLAFYSISNQLITAHRDPGARFFVDLYKMADEGNPESWYFSAILYARAGQFKPAESELSHAVDKGFNDRDRLRAQPEFQPMSDQVAAIAGRMH